MPVYTYTAVSKKGEYITKEETAKDEHDLARLLHEKGYVLIEAQEKGVKGKSFRIPSILTFTFGVSLQEKLVFMRNLKVMVAAGITLPRALEILGAQTKNRKLKKALVQMREMVLKGQQLSEAMELHPSIFPDLFRNMIRAGEESGTLETVLSQLTLQLEREHDLRSKIQGALMYPAVIVVAMIGIGILMLVMVVPNLAATFQELGVQLPASTRFVISFAEFLTQQWYLAIGIFLVAVGASYQALRTNTGKRVVDEAFLHLPLFSGITKKIQTALFARTMSSLIGAGIPIVRSLEVTATVLDSASFKASLLEAAGQMRKGKKLSETLERYSNLYPLAVIQMIEVGEETGQTGDLLAKLAEFFEEEVNSITKNLASIIEPVLMLIIGAVVGFFAISMIQPMYSMLGTL